jgi:glutathione synthase
MERSVAIQGDNLDSLELTSDTSLFIGSGLYADGYKVFWYHPKALKYENDKFIATGRYIKVFYNQVIEYEIDSDEVDVNLESFSCIMIRQNPPVDMKYIASTHILSLLQERNPKILFINNPNVVRDNVEKLLPISIAKTLQNNEIVPPTLISGDYGAIKEFLAAQQHIVIKPIYGYGGDDVIQVKSGEESKILEYLGQQKDMQVISQKFLQEIYDGCKRVITCDDEIIGTFVRVAAKDSFLTNSRAGSTIHKSDLTPQQHNICIEVAKELKRRDIFFAGLDLIGDFITEINITSPSGLIPLVQNNGMHSVKRFFDNIKEKIMN